MTIAVMIKGMMKKLTDENIEIVKLLHFLELPQYDDFKCYDDNRGDDDGGDSVIMTNDMIIKVVTFLRAPAHSVAMGSLQPVVGISPEL